MLNNTLRFTGLFSGMDTQSMVQQIMRAESMRMDRFTQRRQLTQWRQEDYREISKMLHNFQRDFIAIDGKHSIINSATLNTVKSNVTLNGRDTNAIQVVTNANSEIGNYRITVNRVAQADSMRSTGQVFNRPSLPGSENLNLSTRIHNNTVDSNSTNWQFYVDSNTGQTDYSRIVGALNREPSTAGNSRFHDLFLDANGNPNAGVTLTGTRAAGTMTVHTEQRDSQGNIVLDTNGQPVMEDRVVQVMEDVYSATLQINGTDVTIRSDMSINDIMAAVRTEANVHMRFDGLHGAFVMTALDAGPNQTLDSIDDTTGLMEALGFFQSGQTSWTRPTTPVENQDIPGTNMHWLTTAGDAEIVFQRNNEPPVTLTSSNNSFNVLGHHITLTAASGPIGGTPQVFEIETARDSSKAIENVKAFVEAYNTVIEVLNAAHTTARPRNASNSFFEPLTKTMREGMSEDEIRTWERQARTGLLHRDNLMRNLHNQFRSWMFEDVQVPGFGNGTMNITQLGIMTENDIRDGRLVINEEQLTKMLNENPDAVMNFFSRVPTSTSTPSTQQERQDWLRDAGLGTRFGHLLTNAIGLQGEITRFAGVEHHPSTLHPSFSSLSRNILEFDHRINDMQRWLNRRENQLFSMFARMERAMAQSQAQMDAIWAGMGGGGMM